MLPTLFVANTGHWHCGSSMFGPCFVINAYVVSFQFCNHLDEEERASCFTLNDSLMSFDY